MREECFPLETVCVATISDHDMIGLQVGKTDPEPKIKPVDPPFRMSRTLIKRLANRESKLYKHSVELINDARIRLDQYRASGVDLPSHKIWDELKARLKQYYSETDLKLRDTRWKQYNRMNKLLKFNSNKSIPQQVADKAKAMLYFKNLQKVKIQNIKQDKPLILTGSGMEKSAANFSSSLLNSEMHKIKSPACFPAMETWQGIMKRINR
jgi:hypothetical protein